MNFEELFQALGVYQHMTAVLLGMPRLFLVATIAPFLGGTVVTGQLRLVLVASLYLVLHPMIVDQLPAMDALTFHVGVELALLLFKEALIGLLLGFLAGIAFWTIQSAGFFIDNQRGASMSEGTDMLSGDQTTPTGGLLFQSMTYLFYTTGAFLTFLGVVYSSYEFWPVTSLEPLRWSARAPLFFAGRVGWLLTSMLLLSGPIVAACLLTDISLGLVNRFASQLNVYVLAMPIKSGLASFLLCFYFGLLLAHTPALFAAINESILKLPALLAP